MISFVKKASFKDLYKMAYAVMCLKTTSNNITTDEMRQYIDRCYYCEDRSGNVIAIVAAERVVLEYPSEVAGEIIKTYPNKYRIKYMLFDQKTIEEEGEDSSNVMRELLRELTADMNDWTVNVDLEAQSKMSLSDKDECKEILNKALKYNGFKDMSTTGDLLLRGVPLDFDSFH